jgi:hypothetical protein
MLIPEAIAAHIVSILLGPLVGRRFFLMSQDRERHPPVHFWAMLALFAATLTVFATTSIYFVVHGAREENMAFLLYGFAAGIAGAFVTRRMAQRVE